MVHLLKNEEQAGVMSWEVSSGLGSRGSPTKTFLSLDCFFLLAAEVRAAVPQSGSIRACVACTPYPGEDQEH